MSQAKSQAYHVKGLKNKFTCTSNLQTFKKKMLKHLVAYGLDTITYLQSPTDVKKVVCAIKNHALYTLKEGVKVGNVIKELYYDQYCHENDRDAKEFLLNLVDEELETQLYKNCTDEDSFIAMWFNLIHLVRSVSVD